MLRNSELDLKRISIESLFLLLVSSEFCRLPFNFINMVNLLVLLVVSCLSPVWSREVGKNFKPLPTVTNSLVNLGKLDISFYFDRHPEDALRSDHIDHGSESSLHPKKETILEACPCSSIKYMRDSPKIQPSNLLDKILSGNDLFTFKEPTSSPMCCDSHEHTHEDIIFEFGPKQGQGPDNSQNVGNSFPFLPYILELLQNKPSLPSMPMKPKAVEILFFPKKTEISPKNIGKLKEKKKTGLAKKNIVVVGNKEIKNEFKSDVFAPPLPSTTVKSGESVKIISKGDGQATTIDDKKNVV